jgi:galactarate dehydratase
MSTKPIILRILSSDNVAIAANKEGIRKGDETLDGVIAREDVPMGHKLALVDFHPNDPVIRYGCVIGRSIGTIPRGTWVQEHMLEIPEAPDLDQIHFTPTNHPVPTPLEGYTFEGYRNPDGTVGTKNVLGISMSVQCVAGMANHIVEKIRRELLPRYPNVDDVIVISHTYGCGVAINAPAAIIPIQTIHNLARNPNLGGEVMVLGLGCEKLRPESILGDAPGGDIVYLQDESLTGFQGMVTSIMQTAERHLQKLNARKRETCPVSDLVVGMQCGGSDAFSGLTGNPVSGFAADLIVRTGGTVFFSEVTEVRDAIVQLVERAADESVAQQLIDEMRWYDRYLHQGSADRSANTTPGNKKGGLSNIVEKAMGSVVKSGTMPIVDVVSPGDRIRKKGLNFVATPASDFVCGTLQLAAGMNLHLFITGRGTPYGLTMAPVIKISSNSALANRWHDLIDFDAGPVATGEKTIEEMGWSLFHYMLDVASGRKKVATDVLGLYNELVLFNPGPLT